MHLTHLQIQHILQKTSIIDYLAKKGHEPVRALSGGRFAYLCPLPGHSETKPSFYVWTFSEYENFYCFGCQARYNIIHLISHMENVRLGDVIRRLAEGFDLSSADEVKFEQELIKKGHESNLDHAGDLASHLLHISTICNEFLKSVEHNKEECVKIDELWKLVDDSLISYDIENIESIVEVIGEVIDKRMVMFSQLEKSKLTKEYSEEDK